MPTYVYRCTKGHVFELFHGMNDDAPKRCPKCKAIAKRVPASGSGLLFKGSGFYITDYRSKSYREGAKSESPKTESPKSESPKSEGAGDKGSKGKKSDSGPKKSSGD